MSRTDAPAPKQSRWKTVSQLPCKLPHHAPHGLHSRFIYGIDLCTYEQIPLFVLYLPSFLWQFSCGSCLRSRPFAVAYIREPDPCYFDTVKLVRVQTCTRLRYMNASMLCSASMYVYVRVHVLIGTSMHKTGYLHVLRSC